MNGMMRGVRRFIREDDGAAIAEYGLLLAIVAVGLIAILAAFRNDLSEWWNRMRGDTTETPGASSHAPAPMP